MIDTGSAYWPLAFLAAWIAAFLLPLLARRWVWLGILGLLALIPAAALTLATVTEEEDMRRGFGTLLSLGSAFPAVAGTCTRALTLGLAQTGHKRPWSLWVEAVAGVAVLVMYLIFFGVAM